MQSSTNSYYCAYYYTLPLRNNDPSVGSTVALTTSEVNNILFVTMDETFVTMDEETFVTMDEETLVTMDEETLVTMDEETLVTMDEETLITMD